MECLAIGVGRYMMVTGKFELGGTGGCILFAFPYFEQAAPATQKDPLV